jgi:pimeloyl-ACP methyl ester carboxylesterase
MAAIRRAFTLLVLAALALLVLAAIVAAAWLGYGELRRSEREKVSNASLAPAAGRRIDVGDARLFVQEWGPVGAPAIVLLHGTGAWSGTWFELPTRLASAGWRVVALDLPPFGFSEPRESASLMDYSRQAQARRVLRVVESLGAERVVLVGHSFGAGPALEAALLDASRLSRLVLVDPALGLGAAGEPPACTPAPPWAAPWLDQRRLRTAVIAASATEPEFTAWLLRRFVHRKEAVTEERVAPYRMPMRRYGFSAALGDWARRFAEGGCETAESLRPDRLATWAAAGLPVALIWGADDTITPIAQAASLRRWIPQARLVTLPGVGHIPHLEDPAAFSGALLETIGPAPAASAPPETRTVRRSAKRKPS